MGSRCCGGYSERIIQNSRVTVTENSNMIASAGSLRDRSNPHMTQSIKITANSLIQRSARVLFSPGFLLTVLTIMVIKVSFLEILREGVQQYLKRK